MTTSLTFLHALGGTVTYPPGAKLALRTLRDYELVWIQHGQVTYHVNGKDIPAGPASVILSRPGFVDGYTWDKLDSTRHSYIHFAPRRLPNYFPPSADWPIIRLMPDADIVRPLFEFVATHLAQSSRTTPTPPIARALETLLAAYLVGPLGREVEVPRQYPEAVYLAVQWAAKRLAVDPAARINLPEMAAAAAVTGKHLCRVFQHTLNVSPMEAVLALRLNHAAQLLARTDFKLEVIARQTGFATVYHFSRRFTDLYGRPPSVARREMHAGRWDRTGPVRLGGLAVEY